jgi:hypothetical protein
LPFDMASLPLDETFFFCSVWIFINFTSKALRLKEFSAFHLSAL